MGSTKPAAGVMATSPPTAPVTTPSTLAFLSTSHSTPIPLKKSRSRPPTKADPSVNARL